MYFDSYAILAFLKGKDSYHEVLKREGFTHQMNILEVITHLIRRGYPTPRKTVDALGLSLVAATDDDIEAAAILKASSMTQKNRMSYVDALGYILAARLGRPFVTGDAAFRLLPNVLWIPES